jgi:hypothetical protein
MSKSRTVCRKTKSGAVCRAWIKPIKPGRGGGPMAFGGGNANPDKPFASEANKQALDDLLAAVQK